jgi:hypothetical protein
MGGGKIFADFFRPLGSAHAGSAGQRMAGPIHAAPIKLGVSAGVSLAHGPHTCLVILDIVAAITTPTVEAVGAN